MISDYKRGKILALALAMRAAIRKGDQSKARLLLARAQVILRSTRRIA